MRLLRVVVLVACSSSAEARATLGEGTHPVEPQASCEARRASRKFNVLFQGVEVEKLVQTVADATCRTFIVPDAVKGKISIIGPEGSPGQLDADGFYAAFLAALDANALTVLRSGAFFRIIEKAKAGKSPIETVIDPEAIHRTNEEMVTRLFRLRSAELEPVRTVLAQLVTPGADIVPYPPDILIVTELGTNLGRLERLVAQLDVAPAADELQVLAVRFASAPDLAEKLTRMLDKTRGASAKTPAPGGPLVVGDERTNKLVVVANAGTFDKVRALLAELDVPLPGDGRATVYNLKNAEAKDVASTLEPLLQGAHAKAPAGAPASGTPLFTGDVKVSASEATNSLVIVANPADYRVVARLIEELDTPRRQVFIEAAILELDTERDMDLGVSGHDVVSIPTPGGSLPLLLGTNFPGDASSLSLGSLLGVGGIVGGLQGPILTKLSQAVGVNIPEFGLVLHALEKSSDVNVISTPHLLAMDNKEAVIHVGQKVPFQTGYSPQAVQQAQSAGVTTAVSSISQLYAPISRENVELKLTIKPHIGDGDEVRLEVDESTEEIATIDKVLGPTTSTRGAKTTIVGQDHRTVVMGGLMQDRTFESVSKIPFLGDLPLLGNLFRTTSTIKRKVNLLLFLTPHIIRTREDFEEISQRKSDERQKMLEQEWGERGTGEPPVDFRHNAGPVAALGIAVRREESRPENGGHGNPGERVVGPSIETTR